MTVHARMLRSAFLAAGAAALLLSAACGGGDSNGGDNTPGGGGTPGNGTDTGSLSGEVTVDGSSTVGPIGEAMAEEFGKVSNVQVAVGISGTSGGFEKFCRGETDISNASRPIRTTEAQLCADNGIDVTEFTIAIDGLTVVVNPENTWATCLTFSQLRKVFDQGSTLSNWNEVDPAFPDQGLKLYSPGADSGTFDYFSEEVNGTVDQFRNDTSVTFSEDDNVLVAGVEAEQGALGYFGFAYYQENSEGLTAVAVDRDIDKAGLPLPASQRTGCIVPSVETVKANTYPLSRPLFMYVSSKSLDKPQVRGFMEFVLTNPELVADVGYVPLDDALYAQSLSKLRATR